MYCTIQDFVSLLPSSVKVGDNNPGVPTPGSPATKQASFNQNQVIRFIKIAQQEIDSRLLSFYQVPLRRIKIFETEILSDALTGNTLNVRVHDSSVFSKYDIVRLQNRDITEVATIHDVPDQETITLVSLKNDFLQADNSIVSILEFPDPIPLMAARYAVSFGFDELYTGDQAPNVSAYGSTQRQLANNAMDGILDGTIKLFGQEMTGRRFIRGQLFDAYKNPVKDFQYGREKPSANG